MTTTSWRVWVIAHVIGDAGLEARAASAMRASPSLVRSEINARLNPESANEQEELALVKKIIGR